MKSKLLFWGLFVLTALGFSAVFARYAWIARDLRRPSPPPRLIVLAYDSFASPMGPGPDLIREFERTCDCKVELITGGDAGFLLEKLKMVQSRLKVDVVLGLDQLLLGPARKAQKWRPLALENTNWEGGIQHAVSGDFIPFDWAPMTFIYRRGEILPPASPSELSDPRFQGGIALQDPRSSSPGLQLLHALPRWLGDSDLKNFLSKFKGNIHSVSPSWSASYGLFQRGQAKLVFSYLTSLIYHWSVEKNENYQAVSFQEGHPSQIEFVGVPEQCGRCDLAENFVRHLLQNNSQRLIMRKNFMYPAVRGVVEGTIFESLPKLSLFDPESAAKVEAERPGLLESWQNSMK